ncbi:glycine cleavage system aminomethyltransferase GcvT [Amphiplicatus metriothermophilus]|uniref:aminomethyltransferase n=1 Tax=Amphiplicatus metriothermophilus TaxID=1519374 RepID=A0A239PJI0_9PROT|nr:glycine cleavage system aminomethyltransferase GcvT [Amphiplicatus metriothermophilus]MBB5517879.1 aminomethyltransferase [Amphiplicatus metriothermophilus]SNT67787.1 aminomethyltransferase [Amphiplicatus metriothermophilus]
MTIESLSDLKRTALHELHLELGAKMVPFAGYAMPVQYPDGVLKEHLHTREKAGLFDVSHMGQAFLRTTETPIGSEEAHRAVADAIETLVPGEIRKLKKGGLRYSVFLNDQGGILDDLMITRPEEDARQGALFLVVNAAVKDRDFDLLKEKLSGRTTLEILESRSLLAIQGPKAAGVVEALLPGSGAQGFMTMRARAWNGVEVFVSRCGYTGEDGFEISVPDTHAGDLARALLDHPDVAPAGLGARDSLRLEAGLCLYGHDIDETTSPVEADLAFAIGKRRREEGGFPGAARILKELAESPKRKRVGIRPEGRAPAREGTEIQTTDGVRIGVVTSGGFGPSVNGPVAMGYVAADFAAPGTALNLIVRGKALAARVVAMPFAPHRYFRG